MKGLIKGLDYLSSTCRTLGETIIGICGIGILVSMIFAIIPRAFLASLLHGRKKLHGIS